MDEQYLKSLMAAATIKAKSLGASEEQLEQVAQAIVWQTLQSERLTSLNEEQRLKDEFRRKVR
jgi:hypothetical protein